MTVWLLQCSKLTIAFQGEKMIKLDQTKPKIETKEVRKKIVIEIILKIFKMQNKNSHLWTETYLEVQLASYVGFFTLKAQSLFLPIGVPFVLSKGESSKSHNSDLVIFLVRKKNPGKKYFSCRYLKLSVWVCCAGAGCLQLLILTETFKRTLQFFSSRQ